MILASVTLVKFCDFAKMALVCEHHDMGYLEICCNLYKALPINLCFSWLQNNSQNSRIMMDSDKHYEGNHLYIWQLCMLLWHPWSLQNSVILQLCDLGILGPPKICKGGTCLWTSWHGVQRNRLQSLQKHVQSIFFLKPILKIALVL